MVHELKNKCNILSLTLEERYSLSKIPNKLLTFIVIERTSSYVRVSFGDSQKGMFYIEDSLNTPFFEFPMSSLEKELV